MGRLFTIKLFSVLAGLLLLSVSAIGQIKITNFSTSDVSCSGNSDGKITFTTLGGPAPFSYILTGPGEDTVITTVRNFTFTNLAPGTYILVVRDNSGKFDVKFPLEINEPLPLDTTSATSISDVKCSGGNDGSIFLDMEGGTPPYSYSWSNGASTKDISNLAVGNYTVNVTDNNGCTFSKTFAVNQTVQLNTSPILIPVSCNGGNNGEIHLNTSGGTAPYSYSWNTGASTENLTNLSEGSYNVTITDANSCSISGSFTIIEPTALTLTGTPNDATCNGGSNGSINLSVSGGNSPYTYLWNNSSTSQNLSNVGAGNYTVQVTDDNGCPASATYTITEPLAINITPIIIDANCNGGNTGSIDLTISGGTAPYTYTWSNGITTKTNSNLTAGNYSVTVTDSKGCSRNSTFTISEPSIINISGIVTNATCLGINNGSISLSVTGGVAPYSFLWNNGQTTQNLSNLSNGTYTVIVTDNKGCIQNSSFTITQPSAFTITPSITNINCFGETNGSINLNVSGGTTPYSFTWNTGSNFQNLSGIGAGNYSVTISDQGGCSESRNFTITQPSSALTATGAKTDINCNGGNSGAIDLTISGGTAPYTYVWNNGATTQDLSGLVAGTYSVTVTDNNGCITNSNFTINQPGSITINGTATNNTCNGGTAGSISLTITGGSSPFTYLWNTGATAQNISGLTAGNYSVTVTDANGCSNNASFVINQPNPITLTSSISNISCFGGNNGSIDLTVNGGTSPYNYLWSNGSTSQDLSGVTAGTYTVIVTDNNGCLQNSSFTLTQPTTTLAVSGVKSDVTCNGGTNGAINLNITGGTSPYSFTWNNGATTEDITGLSAGNYTVIVSDNNACTQSISFTITEPAGMTLTGTTVNVACSSGNNGSIDLTVTGGSAPYTYSWNNAATTQDISGLTAGTYSVSVTDNNGCTQSTSFTIIQSTDLVITGNSTDASCTGINNGNIDLIVSGGTAPYTYSWNNGATTQDITNLSSGTYSVTVTDNQGCSQNTSFTIVQPSVMTITNIVTNIPCYGGTSGAIDLTVSGGTTPYTYSWNNGAASQDLSGLASGSYTVSITDNNGCSQSNTYSITQPITPLSATGTKTDIGCNGGNDGSIDLTTTGGTSPYTFSWSNGATTEDLTGLTAGTYTVTITDNNACTQSASFNIIEPTGMTLTGSVNNINCSSGNNGAINLSIAGGASPYSYSWSNGSTSEDISGLTVGNYSVIVTDNNGCTKNISFTITEPTPLIISGNTTNATCTGVNNGSIDIIVSGGTTPYVYSWNNGSSSQNLTNLSQGTYIITVTDANGCTINQTFTISQPSLLTVTNSLSNISCNGGNNGSISLTTTGGTTPYSYSWNTGSTSSSITGIPAGNYSVTVNDNLGCTQTFQYTLTEPQPVTITDHLMSPFCHGDSNGSILIDITGGTTPYSYSWSNGATTEDITNLNTGSYSLILTDGNGCQQTASYNLTEPSPITVTDLITPINCYNENNGSIGLTPSGGTSPYFFNWSTSDNTSNINNLSKGNYSVTITDNNGCTFNRSFTIDQPDSIIISATTTNVSCALPNDGAVDITVTGGNSPYQFLWSTSEISEDISNKSLGNYTVNITDTKGCSATASYSISGPQPIVVSANITPSDCNTNNGAIALTVSNGVGPYIYSWSNGLTTSTINNLGLGSYTVTVTDSRSCSTSASYIISNPDVANYDIQITTPNCNGDSNGEITVSNLTGGTGPFEFSFNNGPFSNVQSSGPISSGTYLISIRDVNGCQEDTSIVLTEPSKLQLSGSSNSPICANATIGQVSLVGTGGTPAYTYSSDNISFNSSNTFNGISNGTHSFYIRDSKGCINSTSVVISTFPLVDTAAINANIKNLTCSLVQTGEIELTNITGGKTPYSFQLNNGISTSTPKFTQLGAGNYTITITDGNGCEYDYPVVVTSPAAIDFTLTPIKLETCNNKDAILGLSNVHGGIAPYTYSFNNGAFQPYTGATQFSSLGSGTYTIAVKDNSPLPGCLIFKSIKLTPKPGPVPFVRIDSTLCHGSSDGKIIIDSLEGGVPTFTYTINQFSNGITRTQSNILRNEQITFSGLPADTFRLVIQDQECSYSIDSFYVYNGIDYDTIGNANMIINQPDPITLDIATTETFKDINSGSVILHNFYGGKSPYFYSLDTLSSSFLPVVNDTAVTGGLGIGSYSIYVKDINQCLYAFNFNIGMGIFIPNLITPNGDNYNDKFEITGLPVGSKLRIYNRWNSRVYVSEDYDNSWQGDDLSDGVYYFDLDMPGQKTYKGWVEILRKQ